MKVIDNNVYYLQKHDFYCCDCLINCGFFFSFIIVAFLLYLWSINFISNTPFCFRIKSKTIVLLFFKKCLSVSWKVKFQTFQSECRIYVFLRLNFNFLFSMIAIWIELKYIQGLDELCSVPLWPQKSTKIRRNLVCL